MILPDTIKVDSVSIFDPITYQNDLYIISHFANGDDSVVCFDTLDGGRRIRKIGSVSWDNRYYLLTEELIFVISPAMDVKE